MYQSSTDQAKAADQDSDGAISENEFLQTLFLFADTDVRDRRVTQAEFMDGYRRYYALPSELLVIMFDLLDDLNDDGGTRPNMDFRDNRNNQYFQLYFQFARGNNVFQNNHRNQGDGVLTSRDVTYQMFVGNNNPPTAEDFQKALMSWVDEAANRLYTINYQPHICRFVWMTVRLVDFAISPGNPWDREFDYELWFHSVDRNNDSLISFGELRDELRRYSSDGRVSRSRWTERNLQVYGDKEWLANVVFDAWDKNRDLRLDDLDAGLVLREADQNREFVRAIFRMSTSGRRHSSCNGHGR
ncbi:hypothetical protein C0Q70_08488 [Pomacea canaliculata]|uniref:EF-hand domain-containing protein n=1 Tax=Pomacea canaliculata TaxID=400727 RepID=A0A2T7PI23_POMCA|nr:hypothetical protein C0Q70_08488 [Pomacea canaliculata]